MRGKAPENDVEKDRLRKQADRAVRDKCLEKICIQNSIGKTSGTYNVVLPPAFFNKQRLHTAIKLHMPYRIRPRSKAYSADRLPAVFERL